MIDYKKINAQTCSSAAYDLLTIAKRAIEHAASYVVDEGWEQTEMELCADKISRIMDVLWSVM